MAPMVTGVKGPSASHFFFLVCVWEGGGGPNKEEEQGHIITGKSGNFREQSLIT